MPAPNEKLSRGDGLLVVDVQKDFCPGGALPVEQGERVIPVLNRWMDAFVEKGLPLYASRDWHPKRHISFEGEGGRWPPHCIQDTPGAAFHPDLELPGETVIVTKGVRFDQDQNSAFDQTGLAVQLRRDGVERLWVGGLAQDVCVLASVLDALQEGLEVCLLAEATLPVTPEGGKEAIDRMRQAGARIIGESG